MTDLTATFSALADPTRRAILARLAHGEASVSELVEGFALTQPTISSHLKVLEAAGLIRRGRDGQKRPCRLAPEGLRSAADWLAEYERFWRGAVDRLAAQAEAQASGAAAANEKEGTS